MSTANNSRIWGELPTALALPNVVNSSLKIDEYPNFATDIGTKKLRFTKIYYPVAFMEIAHTCDADEFIVDDTLFQDGVDVRSADQDAYYGGMNY